MSRETGGQLFGGAAPVDFGPDYYQLPENAAPVVINSSGPTTVPVTAPKADTLFGLPLWAWTLGGIGLTLYFGVRR